MLSYEKHMQERKQKIVEKRKEALERALDSYQKVGEMNFELRLCDGYMQSDALRIALNLETYAELRLSRSLNDMIKHAERLRDACEKFLGDLQDCKEDFFNAGFETEDEEEEENETTKEVAVLEIA